MKRTASDRRKAVESLLSHEDFRKMTDKGLAEIVGCSVQTVGNIRKSNPDFDCEVRTTRDGKEINSKVTGSGAAARGGRALLDDDQKAALKKDLVARGMGSNLEQSAPAPAEPIAKPKESDQAVILRLEAEVAKLKRVQHSMEVEMAYDLSLIKNLWNLALERRPDLFKEDEQPDPEDILKRVLDSIPAPAAAPPKPEPTVSGAPSERAAKMLASYLKGKPFREGKTVSAVTSNARKVLEPDEMAWLGAELKAHRDRQAVVLESAE
jgi:hypothetical protein